MMADPEQPPHTMNPDDQVNDYLLYLRGLSRMPEEQRRDNPALSA